MAHLCFSSTVSDSTYSAIEQYHHYVFTKAELQCPLHLSWRQCQQFKSMLLGNIKVWDNLHITYTVCSHQSIYRISECTPQQYCDLSYCVYISQYLLTVAVTQTLYPFVCLPSHIWIGQANSVHLHRIVMQNLDFQTKIIAKINKIPRAYRDCFNTIADTWNHRCANPPPPPTPLPNILLSTSFLLCRQEHKLNK